MICPKCKGEGGQRLIPIQIMSGEEVDWVYEDEKCIKCEGKGYLTPEEMGLEKM